MNYTNLEQAMKRALTAPVAPADLVDKVFAKTTRRPSWWARYKMAFATGVAALVIAVGVGINYFHTDPFDNAELVAYMSQTQSDEYAEFLSDLNLFEQEF